MVERQKARVIHVGQRRREISDIRNSKLKIKESADPTLEHWRWNRVVDSQNGRCRQRRRAEVDS